MIYKFKSKATGDVIMLGPNGDQMLVLLGRELTPHLLQRGLQSIHPLVHVASLSRGI